MALDTTDKTSNLNNLTNHGATSSTDTPFVASSTSALFTRASNLYATITDAAQTGLDFSTTFTVEFWMKLNSTGVFQFIIAKDNANANNTRAYGVLVRDSNKLNIFVTDGAGHFDDYRYDATISTGAWHHYAITCDVGNASATTFEFFIDGSSVGHGVAEGATDNISSINSSNENFSLGVRTFSGSPTTEYLDAYLDEVRLWSTVRTASQIANNYQNELTGTETGLVAYYPFETLTSGGRTAAGSRTSASNRSNSGTRTNSGSRTLV